MLPIAGESASKRGRLSSFKPELWILLATLAVGIPTLTQPLGRDQGICAYIGNVILHGGAPYKDGWDTRPPGLFYIDGLAVFLFGKTGLALRLLDLIVQFATAVALSRLGRRFFGVKAGTFAGMLFLCAYFMGTDWWNLANGDIYILLPSTLALLCLLPERKGLRFGWDFLAGELIGIVFWIRYTHGLLFLPAIAAILLHDFRAKPYRAGHRGLRLLFLGAGFAAVVASYVTLLITQGAWADFTYTLFDFGAHYAKTMYGHGLVYYLRFFRDQHLEWGWRNLALVLPALLAAYHLLRKRREELATIMLVTWSVSSYLGFAIMAKFFVYHWFALFGPFSVLAGYAYSEILRKPPVTWMNRKVQYLMVGCLIVSLGVAGRGTIHQALQEAAVLKGFLSREKYWAEFDRIGPIASFSVTSNYVGAAYLRERTSPDDTVLLWSSDTLILFLADRRGIERFSTNLMFTPVWRRRDWMEEFLNKVRTLKPAYAVISFHDAVPHVSGNGWDSQSLLRQFPKLSNYLLDNYTLETVIGNMEFHRRNPHEVEGGAIRKSRWNHL